MADQFETNIFLCDEHNIFGNIMKAKSIGMVIESTGQNIWHTDAFRFLFKLGKVPWKLKSILNHITLLSISTST